MEAVFPPRGSALARGRRRRSQGSRLRHRTAPVTFAEIEEVDEEQELCESREVCSSVERRRRPDELVELSREFAEFRRRRARRQALREPDEVGVGAPCARELPPSQPPPAPHHAENAPSSKTHGQLVRASSEPT